MVPFNHFLQDYSEILTSKFTRFPLECSAVATLVRSYSETIQSWSCVVRKKNEFFGLSSVIKIIRASLDSSEDLCRIVIRSGLCFWLLLNLPREAGNA